MNMHLKINPSLSMQEEHGFSFVDCLERDTIVVPDISHLDEELQQFINKDLFQIRHCSELEKLEIINWDPNLTRLYPLRTQSDGNCLLHAACLSLLGVHDKEFAMRHALYETLINATGQQFKTLWISYNSHIDPSKQKEEWETIVGEATPIHDIDKKFRFLGQLHVFVLSHILRRPIIVYADNNSRDFETEEPVFTLPSTERVDGIYLPLCIRSEYRIKIPIILAFHLSHFMPLIPFSEKQGTISKSYYPIVDKDLKRLPVHYIGENDVLEEYLDIKETEGGIPVVEHCHSAASKEILDLFELYFHNARVRMEGENKRSKLLADTNPCLGECGFMGTAATAGFCSVCFKKQKDTLQSCALNCGFHAVVNGLCSSCFREQNSGLSPISSVDSEGF